MLLIKLLQSCFVFPILQVYSSLRSAFQSSLSLSLHGTTTLLLSLVLSLRNFWKEGEKEATLALSLDDGNGLVPRDNEHSPVFFPSVAGDSGAKASFSDYDS